MYKLPEEKTLTDRIVLIQKPSNINSSGQIKYFQYNIINQSSNTIDKIQFQYIQIIRSIKNIKFLIILQLLRI